MDAKTKPYVLTIVCRDTVGIVAAVSTFFAARGVFISESAHHGDPETERFFMRTVFQGAADAEVFAEMKRAFAEVGGKFAMTWDMVDAARKSRVLILVSRFDHCLNDLLYRYRVGALPIEIPAVVSNHMDLQRVVEWHGVPYHHLPATKETKAEQEAAILEMVERLRVDLVVLARYMQVLSPEMCKALAWRAINIHHSFLPSFKGAKPYRQAHARGVKIIGATAHYVTSDLDEGPIIEQAVERIDHTHTVDDFVAIGRDIENIVLSRAVRFHVERRVLPNGGKTVVFRR
jgi:formyltetrahydrofolate deformylase